MERILIALALAAVVVISVGINLGKVALVPVVLTLAIVIISHPLYRGLKDRGVPAWIARLVVMACAFLAMGGLFLVSGAVLRGLLIRLPLYEVQYQAVRAGLAAGEPYCMR